MKTKNFPAKKLKRQFTAMSNPPSYEDQLRLLSNARNIRSKKQRGNR